MKYLSLLSEIYKMNQHTQILILILKILYIFSVKFSNNSTYFNTFWECKINGFQNTKQLHKKGKGWEIRKPG